VRSKTSRARADLRTIATAIESYMVDNNNYPLHMLVSQFFAEVFHHDPRLLSDIHPSGCLLLGKHAGECGKQCSCHRHEPRASPISVQ
jgi:hypothetical protein